MGWDLTQWVAFARSAQIVGSLVAVGSHGYLTVRVKGSTHGLTKEIMVLEMMVYSYNSSTIRRHTSELTPS